MSNVVDDRVVNMRFDNSNFERNVSTSIGTLDKLKQSLDFSKSQKSLEGLQYASRSFNMSGVADAIMAIQDRFSTMGIVGMTIIQNLTNSALGAVKNVAGKISNMIISGGISRAMNIENAKFQLEGLEIKYSDVFDAIDYAVTNTAYSLDAAAQAASQLSAAGLDYKNVIFTHEKDKKELTQMSMALRAVSGVAAQTQTDYSMVARYFQDVANAGKVTGATLTYMTQVLNLPVEQNLAEGLKAIADGSYEASEGVQNAVKKLTKGAEVSTEQIKEFASKGLISFDMFSTIMFNKYADHAVDANRTLMGVMSNIRSAFSKIGAEFVSPIIEIDGIVVRMLDSIRAKINELKPSIIPLAQSVANLIKQAASQLKVLIDKIDLSWAKPFFTGLGKIIEGITQDLITMRYAFSAVFPKSTTNRLKDFAENFKKFGEDFQKRESSMSRIQQLSERFKGLFSLLSAAKTIISALLSPFKGLIDGLKGITDGAEKAADSFADWAKNLDKRLKESETLKTISDRLYNFGKVLGSSFPGLLKDAFSIFGEIENGPFGIAEEFLTGFAKNFGNTVLSLVETLTGKDLSGAKEAFSNFMDGLIEPLGKIKDAFDKTVERVSEFIEKVKATFAKYFNDKNNSNGSSLIEKAMGGEQEQSKLESFIDHYLGFLDGFLSALEGILDKISEVGSKVAEKLGPVFEDIQEFLTSDKKSARVTSGALKTVGAGVAIFEIKKILDLIKEILSDGQTQTLPQKLGGVIKNVSSNFSNGVLKISPDKLKQVVELGAAIYLFASSISKLGRLDATQLAKGLGAVTILMGEMIGFVKLLQDQLKSSNTTGQIIDINDILQNQAVALGLMMVLIGISLEIMVDAVDKLGNMNREDLIEGMSAITILLGEIIGFIWAIKSPMLSGESALKSLQTVSFGVLLMSVGRTLKEIADAAVVFSGIGGKGNWEGLAKAGASIAAILGVLIGFMYAVPSGKTRDILSASASLILIAESMKIFASAAEDFGKMDWEDLGKAGAALVVIVGAISAFMLLTSKMTTSQVFAPNGSIFGQSQERTTKSLIELGAGLLIVAASMKVFASAAKDLGEMNWEDLGKAGAAFGGILLGLGLLTAATDANDLIKTSAALAILSGAMLILAPALMLFEKIKWGSMAKAGVALVGIIVILGVAAAATSEIQLAMVGLSIAVLAFGTALMSIGAGLLLFSMGAEKAFDVLPKVIEVMKQVIVGAIEVLTESTSLIVEAVFNLIVEILHGLEEKIPEIVDTLLNIIIKVINVVADRVGELASAIRNLVEKLEEAFQTELSNIDIESFALAIGGITVFLVALAATATIVQTAMLGVLGIVAVMAVVTGMFLLLSSIDADKMLVLTQGLSMTMLSLAATMAIISLIPIPAAAMGVAGLAIVVGGIAAILAILGGLAQIPGFEWLLGEGKRVLVQIGDAIGEFVGSIIGGLGVGLTNHLPKIADNLSQFAVRLVPFIATMKLIDLQVVAAAGSLVGIITALTAADILNALTSWLTGGNSIEKFGEQIEALAPHLKAFAEEVRGINAEDTKKAAEAGKALAEMAKALPNEGGVAAFFAGENDMEKFGEKLVSFGKSLVAYAEAIADLDVNAVDKSAAAGKMVAEMAAMMPNTGGVAGFFAGENDIDDFGYKLERFGKSLTQYSKDVAELNVEAVEKSKAAGQVMVDLAATVPNTGGAVSWFTGNNDLNTFGEQLVAFGGFITEYANEVADLNIDAVKASSAAGQIMVDLEAQLKNSGGVASWFAGDDDLETFGHNLQSFGESIVAFSNTLNEAPNLQEGLTLVNELIPAVEGMIGLANALVDTDGSSLTRFARSAKGLVTTLSQIGDMYVGEIVKQFTDCVEQVEEGMEAFVALLVAGLTNRLERMFEMGQKYAQNFIYGLGSKIVDVRNKGSDIGKAAVEGIKSVYPAFYEAGKNCIMGIVNGLNDPEAVSALAARLIEIAEMMMSMVQITLDEHSPSRKFMQIGRYAVEGLAIGLRDDGEVARAATELGDATIENMQAVIDRIGELIDENMDLNPTITPILDLSNVTEGASKVNDMFNRSVISGNIRANASIIQPTIKINDGILQNLQQDDARFGTTFIQNNYSPKALSRVEIYRQTRNQFAQYREAFR